MQRIISKIFVYFIDAATVPVGLVKRMSIQGNEKYCRFGFKKNLSHVRGIKDIESY